MEYIPINDARLKVTCERCDLLPYGIRAEELEYSNAETRKFLEDILEGARKRFGFESKLHRILVQLYPSKDGGCEIFINRLAPQRQEQLSDAKKESDALVKKKGNKVFFFDGLAPLLEVCKRLSICEFEGKSSAFYLDGTGYFLSVELDCELEEYQIFILDEYSFIYEYGEAENASERIPYLMEYGRCICCENAVETLGKI